MLFAYNGKLESWKKSKFNHSKQHKKVTIKKLQHYFYGWKFNLTKNWNNVFSGL